MLKGYTDKGKQRNELKRALKRKETKMLEFQEINLNSTSKREVTLLE